MANRYQKISELDTLGTELRANDMFIVSRPDAQDQTAYSSYKCGYDKLSSDVKQKIINVLSGDFADISSMGLVNSYSAVNANGTRIVQENTIHEIKTRIESQLGGSYLSKTETNKQTVQGDVEFKGTVTIPDDPTGGTDAVNKKYVDDTVGEIPDPTYFNKHGITPLSSYLLVSKQEYEDLDDGQIFYKSSNPLIFYNDKDRLLQIQVIGSITGAKPLGIFAYDTASTSYDDMRSFLIGQFKKGDLTNINLLDVVYINGQSNSRTVAIANLNVRSGTWIVLSKGIVVKTEKTTIDIQVVHKNKNKNLVSQHSGERSFYSDANGYSYHFKKTTVKGKDKYTIEKDLDSNGKRFKLYTNGKKTVNKCVIDTRNALFATNDVVNFNEAL